MSAGAARLAAVRRFTRAVRPPVPLGRRADAAYSWALTAVIFGVLLYGVAARALAVVVTPRLLAEVGPAVAAVLLLAAARWGALLGPVVFSRPDVAHLLDAPLPRGGLAVRRLVRGLAMGAVAGAVLGALVAVGAAGGGRDLGAVAGAARDTAGGADVARVQGVVMGGADVAARIQGVVTTGADVAARIQGVVTGGSEAVRVAALVLGGALGGVLLVALAQAVAVSARWQRVTLRGLPVLVAALALAAWLGAGDWLAWTGPWGWVLLPGTATVAWPAATAALALLAAAAAGLALRAAGAGSTERHERRARLRSRLGAATAAYDARGTRILLRERDADPTHGDGAAGVGAKPTPGRWYGANGRGVPRPTDERWAMPWRHVLAWGARPATPLAAGALAIAGGAAAAQAVDDRWWGLAAGALLYGAVASLLEPLRAEIDVPQRALLLLGRPVPALVEAHLVAPVLLVGAGTLVGALAGLVLGGGALPAFAAVFAVAVVAGCAACSALRGGRLPDAVLFTAVTSDPSGGGVYLTLYALAWPLTAAALVTGAVALAVAGPTPALIGLGILALAGSMLRPLLSR